MSLLNRPSQHIQRPGRVSLSGEKPPSARQCCPASGSGASSAPEGSSPWPPHFLWKRERERWCSYSPFPLAPPPSSPFLHSPSLSLNFLMATSSLVSCKDTRMQHKACRVRGEKRKEKSEPKAHWEYKKRKWCFRSCRKKNAILSFYLCDVLACKRPTASLARFMCKPPAFSSPIDLAEKY